MDSDTLNITTPAGEASGSLYFSNNRLSLSSFNGNTDSSITAYQALDAGDFMNTSIVPSGVCMVQAGMSTAPLSLSDNPIALSLEQMGKSWELFVGETSDLGHYKTIKKYEARFSKDSEKMFQEWKAGMPLADVSMNDWLLSYLKIRDSFNHDSRV